MRIHMLEVGIIVYHCKFVVFRVYASSVPDWRTAPSS